MYEVLDYDSNSKYFLNIFDAVHVWFTVSDEETSNRQNMYSSNSCACFFIGTRVLKLTFYIKE